MSVRRAAVRVGVGVCAGSAMLVFGAGAALADQAGDHGADGDRVTICHATGSATNPYVVITPSAAGVLNGHYAHQDQRDIIPPFTLRGQSYPGHNWSSGQAVYNNGCKLPSTPATPSAPGGGKTPGGVSHPGGGDTLKVTICHATGSQTNPFVRITPAAEGVIDGHYAHQDQRDVIPPFTFGGKNYPGQNWDSRGKAIYNNDCKVPGTTGTTGTTGTGTTGTTGTGTPGTTGGSTVVPTTSNKNASAPSVGSYTVPSGSVHAGEYDSALSAGEWAGIGLMGTAVASAAAMLARRRVGRVSA